MSNLHQKLLHQKVKRFEPREVDVTLDILQQLIILQPHSAFVQSLHQQYCDRGGLSRKQLEGLHNKASKYKEIPVPKLATLAAIILQKPTKHKSVAPLVLKPAKKDEESGKMLEEILAKFPAHKRVRLLQSLFEKNKALSNTDKAELERFYKLLIH